VEASELIESRLKETDGTYVIDSGDGNLMFLVTDTGTVGELGLDPIEDSSSAKRKVLIGNLTDADIPAGKLVLAHYLDGYYFVGGVGGGSGATLYRYELTSGFTSNVADADILQMNGDLVVKDSVSDPEGIFSTLGTGDTGLCFLSDGTYYIIQAGCPAV
jgi:hypothetical protein